MSKENLLCKIKNEKLESRSLLAVDPSRAGGEKCANEHAEILEACVSL